MRNRDIDCIHLTDQHSQDLSVFPFWKIMGLSKYAHHKIIVRRHYGKRSPLQFIRSYENPWQLTLRNTRAQLSDPNFYTVQPGYLRYKEERSDTVYFYRVIQGQMVWKWWICFKHILKSITAKGLYTERVNMRVYRVSKGNSGYKQYKYHGNLKLKFFSWALR